MSRNAATALAAALITLSGLAGCGAIVGTGVSAVGSVVTTAGSTAVDVVDGAADVVVGGDEKKSED
ncbi:MAG: hypothetical protein MRY74_07095 [Neomegalonema sp.]|nr:hypothetical protein [Neomegalonema sp.]